MIGTFRKLLSDLIKDMHNSNKCLVQFSLFGETMPEERFCVLGFVPIDEVEGLSKEIWFSKLNRDQIKAVNEFLSELKRGSW